MNTIQSISKIQKPHTYPTKPIKPQNEFEKVWMKKLSKVKSDDVKTEVEKLYKKVVEHSDKLGDRLYLQDLIDYKKSVKEFLDMAVQNAHAFTKEHFLDRRGRHRVFSKVKEVDHALSELTQDFISHESNRLSVIKKLDHIKGLLLDIMM